MSYQALRAILVFLFAATLVTSAKPRSDSVAAYQSFLDSMEQEIEKKIDDRFRIDEDNLTLMSKPLDIDTKVDIRVKYGPRMVRTVSGTFRELRINTNPPYAQISDRRVYWEDIVPIDQKRLYWGAQEDRSRLTLEIERERNKLEEEKEQVRRVERNSRLAKHGYTTEWFKTVLKLSGTFQERTKLGDNLVEISLEIDDANPLVEVTLTNQTRQPSIALITYDGETVSSNLPAEFSTEFPELYWEKHSFWMLKSDLGEDLDSRAVSSAIYEKFRVRLMAKDVGSWWLTPNKYRTGSARPVQKDSEVCPLCYGAGETEAIQATVVKPEEQEAATETEKVEPEVVDTAVATAEILEDEYQQAASSLEVCPMCNGNRTITSPEPHASVTITHRLKLSEANMEDYSPQASAPFFDKCKTSVEYQAKVDKLIEAVKKDARDNYQDQLLQMNAAAAEAAAEEAKIAAAKAAAEKIRSGYRWLTSIEGPENYPRADSPKADATFDDIDYPRSITVDGKQLKVNQFSHWNGPTKTFEKVVRRPRRYVLRNLTWRVIEVSSGDNPIDPPRYFLQYRVEIDATSEFQPIKLSLTTKFILEGRAEDAKDDEGIFTKTNTFTFSPTQRSTAVCTLEVDANTIGTGIDDITLEEKLQK